MVECKNDLEEALRQCKLPQRRCATSASACSHVFTDFYVLPDKAAFLALSYPWPNPAGTPILEKRKHTRNGGRTCCKKPHHRCDSAHRVRRSMRHDHQRTCTFRDTRSFVHLYCFALPHASSPSPAALRNQWQPTKVRRAFPLRPLRKARTRLNNLPPPPQARPPLPQTFPMPMRQMLLAFNRSSSRKRAGGQKMATCITA